MSNSHWRNKSIPIIAAVLREHPLNGPEQRKALYDAYPFGERSHYPYKIWLDEIKSQKGTKDSKGGKAMRVAMGKLFEHESIYGKRPA
jgi:hypothetical protein